MGNSVLTPEIEEIYTTFHPKIHRYLARLVGEQDAEDLTQEVFVKVNRALENFRGEARLSTWIYRIATNAAYDRMRSQSFNRIEGELPISILEEDTVTCDATNARNCEKQPLVEQQVVRDEMNQCISGFIQGLAENYRTVLVLSEFESLEDKEIANILGISSGTVKIRLHRARERLKEALAAHCDTYWLEDNEFVPELKFRY